MSFTYTKTAYMKAIKSSSAALKQHSILKNAYAPKQHLDINVRNNSIRKVEQGTFLRPVVISSDNNSEDIETVSGHLRV